MNQAHSWPIVQLKNLHLDTSLDRVTLVAGAAYMDQAHKLNQALRARLGTQVRITTTFEKPDVDQTLIALGDLSTNPLLERLYHAYMSWTDRRYPGPSGYEVRTLHNPFGHGRNIVLLGCSDEAGAWRAVEAFLDRAAQPVLPPLLDVELADDADAQFRAAAGDYYPYKHGLSDALRYYLTGREDIGQAYRQYLLGFDPEDMAAGTSGIHMSWLFDMALWDLIEERPIFSDDDRLRITNFFLALARSQEGIGYFEVPQIMDDDGPRQNHHTNTAFAVWLAARYFERDYPHLPGLALEVAHWRRVIAKAFAPGRTTSRGQCETWHEWELELDINFDYFAASDDPVFVTGGALRAAAERIILSCTNTGTIANGGDIFPWQQPPPCGLLGKAAYVYGDPRYRFFTRRKSLVWHRVGMTSLNGAGREYDDGLAGARPDDHIGVRHCMIDPTFYHFHGHAPRFYTERMFLQMPNTPLERSLDKIAFRSGWAPQDQYLLIDGVSGASHGHEDANAILQFDEFERTWLVDGDYRGPDVTRHNALTIAADGLGSPLPAFAEKSCIGNLDQIGFSHSIMRDYGGADWGRAVIWLRGRAFLFLDRVTALPSLSAKRAYNVALRWFTAGDRVHADRDGRLSVVQRTPAGARVSVEAIHIDTLLGAARTSFQAPAGDYRLRVALSVTRATTWANSVVLEFDERYPVEFIIGDRLDPPGKVDEAVLEGRVRLRDGPAHLLSIFLGTALRAAIRRIELIADDGATHIELPVSAFEAVQRRSADTTAMFHIVPGTAYDGRVISEHATLAEQWARYPWHAVTRSVMHEWQQTARVQLLGGAAFTFANLLYAETPSTPRRFAVRELRDGLVRISGGDEAIAGFGPLEKPDLRTDAELVYVAAHRLAAANATYFDSPWVTLRSNTGLAFEYDAGGHVVFDCDHTAAVELIIAGQAQSLHLTPGRHSLPAPAVVANLVDVEALAISLDQQVTQRIPHIHRDDFPSLAPVARFDAPLRALMCHDQGWLVGDSAGIVHRLDRHYGSVWRYTSGGAVNSLASGRLNDKAFVVAGCEDCQVYALDGDGRQIWQREFGILPETYGLYAGLGQIRRVHVDDLDADGQPEIYVSPDNMHLHALSADGRERWRMVSLYGPYANYQAIDLYAEGQRVLVGGMAFNTCHSAVQVVDHTGHYVDLYVNDGWTSALDAVWVGDIDGDGKLEIAAGTNRGWVRVFNARSQPLGRPMAPFYGDVTLKSFDWAEPRDRIRWAQHLGEPVRAVAGFAGMIVGAADNGFITAFDPAGVKCWSVQAPNAITHLVVVGERCYALSRAGELLVLSPAGHVIDQAQLGGSLTAAQTAGQGALVAANDGGLYAI